MNQLVFTRSYIIYWCNTDSNPAAGAVGALHAVAWGAVARSAQTWWAGTCRWRWAKPCKAAGVAWRASRATRCTSPSPCRRLERGVAFRGSSVRESGAKSGGPSRASSAPWRCSRRRSARALRRRPPRCPRPRRCKHAARLPCRAVSVCCCPSIVFFCYCFNSILS